MTTTNIIGGIMDALLGGLTSIVSSIPNAIKTCFENLFFTTTGTGEAAVTAISPFAVILLCFGGVALAIGIGRLVLNMFSKKVGA